LKAFSIELSRDARSEHRDFAETRACDDGATRIDVLRPMAASPVDIALAPLVLGDKLWIIVLIPTTAPRERRP